MKLFLVDTEIEMVEAWKHEFTSFPEVNILCTDILSVAENSLVSPANSYGYMDGGIDKLYISYFGERLEKEVINTISKLKNGMLPVGSSLLLKTYDEKIPYLFVSPTMELPGIIPSINCYKSFSAALRMAHKYQDVITKLFCPGLGTGIGQVDYKDSAHEMMLAYKNFKES